MKTTIRLILLLLMLGPYGFGQTTQAKNDNELSTSALNYRVANFELTDSTLIEGLSKLSFEAVAGLHMGIEEIIRDKSSEPTDRSVRFSLTLRDVAVRDIIDTLCKSDRRYSWSTDGSSVNVFPRETVGNPSYLLNRELDLIALKNINGPTDALTPLMKLLPGEQIGYAGIGVNNDYREPWSVVFSHLTVRQLMNRLSEHNGPRGGWIWNGSRGQRFFAFFERDFKEW